MAAASFGQTYPQPGSGSRSVYETAPMYPSHGSVEQFKNSTLLSTYELDMMNRVGTKPVHSSEAQKRATLKNMSQSRYKNWGNTLEAQRTKKKMDKIKRLNDIEAAQQELDREEAEYKAQQRREAIERANRILFKEKDRVKGFDSALLLSNVMEERHHQIMSSRRKKAAMLEYDKRYLTMQNEAIEKALRREDREYQERNQKAFSAAETQALQRAEHSARRQKEREESIRAGQLAKRMNEEALAEQKEFERLRKERQKETNRAYMEGNLEQRRMKEERLRQEAAEDAKIAQFAAEKERMIAERRALAEAKRAEKQAAYNRMRDRQYENLKKMRQHDGQRTLKQAEELLQRQDQVTAAELAKQVARREEIHLSRQQQIQRRQQEKERRKQEDAKRQAEWVVRNAAEEEAERQRELMEKERNRTLAATLREQHREVQLQKEALAARRMEDAAEIRADYEKQDQEFMQYANAKIESYASKGRSVVPMRLNLARHERAKNRITNY